MALYLPDSYRCTFRYAYERVRNRRKYNTIFYSCVAGALMACVSNIVHGLLLGAMIAILSWYYFTRKLNTIRCIFLIGGPHDS